MPAKFELIAPCFFGCESTAKFELTRIGAENIRVECAAVDRQHTGAKQQLCINGTSSSHLRQYVGSV